MVTTADKQFSSWDTIKESIHQDFEGWEESEQVTIKSYLNDVHQAVVNDRNNNGTTGIIRYVREEYETDSRDKELTVIKLPDGTMVEVNPIELFMNMLENNVMSLERLKIVTQIIDGMITHMHD